MNCKEIASNIRLIAMSFAPDRPNIYNTNYEALRAIADELDPPKPWFVVGQWVELTCAKEPNTIAVIRRIDDEADMASVILMDGDQDIIPLYELTPIPAKDVVLDFGHGIKGRVRDEYHGQSPAWIWVNNGLDIASIYAPALDNPMRSVVESLLARQEVEK